MPRDGFGLVLIGGVRANLVGEKTVMNLGEPCFSEKNLKQARLKRRERYHPGRSEAADETPPDGFEFFRIPHLTA
jgi:hypothetical protein